MLRSIIVLFVILSMDVSIGQVVLTQTQSDAIIGIDRKAWAGLGNTAPLSDGYAHDFILPTSTDSCEQITGISVEVNFTGYTNNGSCPHFETYFNLFYGCTPYVGGATCLPATNLIAEPNYPVNVNPTPFNFGNPLGSPLNPSIEPDFGDNFSVDIIPVSNPGCNPVSNGYLGHQYTITVTVTITDITPTSPIIVNCWDDYQLDTTTCTYVNQGTAPVNPGNVTCWDDYQLDTTTCTYVNQGVQSIEFREEFIVLCENETIDLIVNTNIINPSYNWDSGETTDSISIDIEGVYVVEVTDGCFTEIIEFNVNHTDNPIINNINTAESSIIVNVLGNGNYQYSIDGINYQSSNVFNSLPSGLYTIYVKSFECIFIATMQHLHIFIQKYMTPNGDGNNDLFSLNIAQFFSNFKVYIFDRYGKLLYSATNTNARWDGTFKGNLMPTADYWYSIVLDNQNITGHFTLKR